MVGEKEFASLQGEMGGLYAAANGEAAGVATAIGEHYRPRFAGDSPPSTAAGRACMSQRLAAPDAADLTGAK